MFFTHLVTTIVFHENHTIRRIQEFPGCPLGIRPKITGFQARESKMAGEHSRISSVSGKIGIYLNSVFRKSL